MGVTRFDNINASNVGAKYVGNLPSTPADYYETASNDVASVAWEGGEMAYLSTEDRLYIQTATSGTSPTWKRLLETFATSTSTTTSTTSTTSTTTSTSTSSSTSTSTSTSSTTTA